NGTCLHAGTWGFGVFDIAATPDSCAPPPDAIVAATLPSGRAVRVGSPVTAFATIINPGPADASACSIAPLTSLPAIFLFQTTDPQTNALVGVPNAPIDIPAGGVQTFLIAFAPNAAFGSTEVDLAFTCAEGAAARVIPGVNTLRLAASTSPGPDIVA